MTKVLVLYVFHLFNDRVKYFINHALFQDPNVDFVIIANDKKITFNVPNYVKKVSRDNIGLDFGGWSETVLKDDLYKQYDKFIFVNSSVMGPYVPTDFKGRWTDLFLDGLQGNIKLFGSTINTCLDPEVKSHVQSYIFALDKTTLQFLIDCDIISITNYAKTMQEAIWNKEVLMSRKIIENGWNIGSRFSYYNGVDFTFKKNKAEQCSVKFLDCVCFTRNIGVLWSKEEVVFIKGNRP